MKYIIGALLVANGLLVQAQETDGIHFVKGLSWQQVMDKAKLEHKLIFVDCYATWCGPCKLMDMDVYSRKEVGEAYNHRFISVKLQMDKTSGDSIQVRQWYGTAEDFERNFSITAYPTFLFFDENGVPIHKVSASMSADNFIQLAGDAENPSKQYYAVLKNFQPNTVDTAQEKGLARSFKFSDKSLANKIAVDYLTRLPKERLSETDNQYFLAEFQDVDEILNLAIAYIEDKGIPNCSDLVTLLRDQNKIRQVVIAYLDKLEQSHLSEKANRAMLTLFSKDTTVRALAIQFIDHLTDQQLFVPDNIKVIKAFTDTSTSRGYELFLHHAREVDTAMHQAGYSKGIIDNIVFKETIAAPLDLSKRTGNEPEWKQLTEAISNKYGKSYLFPAMENARMIWYKSQKDWKSYTRSLVERWDSDIEKLRGINNVGICYSINTIAWDMFTYSKNKHELERAVAWCTIGIDDSQGEKLEGFSLGIVTGTMDTKANLLYKLGRKKEALDLEIKTAAMDPLNDDIAANLKKMKEGVPTW